jgi:hypothetical protein
MKELSPDAIPAMIDGTVAVYAYVEAHSEIFFQYSGQEAQPSETGRYRVVDMKSFLDHYVELRKQGWIPGLQPGELEDGEGDRFTVVHYGISLTDDPPVLEPADLPADCFFTQHFSELILYDQETPLNLALNEFLSIHYQGGMPKFLDWLSKERKGYMPEDSKEIFWEFPDGQQQYKSISQAESYLSKMRKCQRELLGN